MNKKIRRFVFFSIVSIFWQFRKCPIFLFFCRLRAKIGTKRRQFEPPIKLWVELFGIETISVPLSLPTNGEVKVFWTRFRKLSDEFSCKCFLVSSIGVRVFQNGCDRSSGPTANSEWPLKIFHRFSKCIDPQQRSPLKSSERRNFQM